jgi:hypothetical protein
MSFAEREAAEIMGKQLTEIAQLLGISSFSTDMDHLPDQPHLPHYLRKLIDNLEDLREDN